MPDVFSPDERSRIMSRVKGRDTKPEMVVRKTLHAMGYRYRLHRKDLPGKPDIVLPKHKKVILVHGCFWHGHPDCSRAGRPTSNEEFWDKKLSRNLERDKENLRELKALGWEPLVIWGCEAKKPEVVMQLLTQFLSTSEGEE